MKKKGKLEGYDLKNLKTRNLFFFNWNLDRDRFNLISLIGFWGTEIPEKSSQFFDFKPF